MFGFNSSEGLFLVFQLILWKKTLSFSTSLQITRSYVIRRRGVKLKTFLSSQELYEFKYRDRLSIIGDILRTVKDSSGKGKRKTQIMQSANLNFDQANKYLAFLISNGYMKAERSEMHEGLVYRATSKGLNFVKTLEAENLRLR